MNFSDIQQQNCKSCFRSKTLYYLHIEEKNMRVEKGNGSVVEIE